MQFNAHDVYHDTPLEPPDTAKYGLNAPWEAPELERMTYIQMWVKVSSTTAVALAMHARSPWSQMSNESLTAWLLSELLLSLQRSQQSMAF